MTLEAPAEHPVARLHDRLGDLVHLPGDPRYDELRLPWNVAVDQRPAAVAAPTTVEEVVAVVRTAAELGLRVAPQGTGHGAAMAGLRSLDDAVLVRTSALSAVDIDPVRRTARVGSGVLWDAVVAAAAEHGLAALHGSSPDVGVAGYALGGGIGWYARKHGLATNSITAVELVTAEGTHQRADAETNADLFWALRGGGGNFGIVTALELRLFEIPDAYAGMLLWDIAAAEPVLRRWAEWCETAPDEVTTSLRIMRFPPMEELPEFLRGRAVVILDGAVLGDDASAERLLAPFRDLGPELDTFARIPAAAVGRIHMDPEEPSPFASGTILLKELGNDTVEAVLDAFGPDATAALMAVEFRQLGGALGRPAPDAGALSHLSGSVLAFLVDMAPTPEAAAAAVASAAEAVLKLAPWASGAAYLNFADGGVVDPKLGYGEDAWDRLRELRRQYDPTGMFVANHPID
ncbi:FAD-binding oxidoreductase [Planctomonas psychrotolerans]|uniref:FAD-binding oxidoreductase n=1 Tax=Planctomonas psychrotolerans TaxID=2528712 RepID=UPI001238C56D|nr:FAD-binding oxidoreductase [Planctomonas psychrotolerans]